MALLDIRQRSGYLFLGVILGHVLLISAQVTTDLSRVASEAKFPVAFGVITCNTREQAVERSSPGSGNCSRRTRPS